MTHILNDRPEESGEQPDSGEAAIRFTVRTTAGGGGGNVSHDPETGFSGSASESVEATPASTGAALSDITNYRTYGQRRILDDVEEDSLLDDIIVELKAVGNKKVPDTYKVFMEVLSRHAYEVEKAASYGDPRSKQVMAVFRSIASTTTTMVEPIAELGTYVMEQWLNTHAIRALPPPD